jgi:hypothetical protein
MLTEAGNVLPTFDQWVASIDHQSATPQGIGWVKASTWPEGRHNDVHWRKVSDKRPLLVIGRNYQENIIAQFGKVYTPEELEWLNEAGQSQQPGREESTEIERRNKLLEDDLKRQCRLNMPGISEAEQENVWQAYKEKHRL